MCNDLKSWALFKPFYTWPTLLPDTRAPCIAAGGTGPAQILGGPHNVTDMRRETKALAIYIRSATTHFLHDVLNTVKDENRQEVPSRQPTLRRAPSAHLEAGSAWRGSLTFTGVNVQSMGL